MRALTALLLLLPALAQADDNEAACRTHLKHLGGAIGAYKLIHSDEAPAKFSDLYLDGLVDSYGDFVCPASGASITATSEIDAKTDYTLDPLPDTKDMLVREKTPHHAGDQVLVLLKDGSIKSMTVPGVAPSQQATAPSTSDQEQPLPPVIAPQMPPPGTTQPTTPPAPPLGPRRAAYLGAQLTDNGDSKGAAVISILPNSPAAIGGLKVSDLILAANGDPIESARQVVDVVGKLSPGARIDLLVWRDGRMQKISFFLGERPADFR